VKLDIKEYYSKPGFRLYKGDSFELLRQLPDESIDMCFADPPYFLSNGGLTCQSGKLVSVDKAQWDMGHSDVLDKLNYNLNWLEIVRSKLQSNGTIWISGTHHNIYTVGVALEMLGFKILNNISWYKSNASPNLSCRYFTHSTEFIIWARKSNKAKHTFNYQMMKSENLGKQMRDVWMIPTTPKREKGLGKHPTQKPMSLLKRIILSSTNEGDTVLDPFNGSGTTGLASIELKRQYIGIDIEAEYLDLTIRRLEAQNGGFI
jgi:site-specific DNA-methyltransferase (adenine-specific)